MDTTVTKLANKVLEAVPGTPEHAIAKQLETGGDISVETGEPLDDSGKPIEQRPTAAPAHKPVEDEIMRNTIRAKAPGLDTPHPPDPDAHPLQFRDLHTADDIAFGGQHK